VLRRPETQSFVHLRHYVAVFGVPEHARGAAPLISDRHTPNLATIRNYASIFYSLRFKNVVIGPASSTDGVVSNNSAAACASWWHGFHPTFALISVDDRGWLSQIRHRGRWYLEEALVAVSSELQTSPNRRHRIPPDTRSGQGRAVDTQNRP